MAFLFLIPLMIFALLKESRQISKAEKYATEQICKRIAMEQEKERQMREGEEE